MKLDYKPLLHQLVDRDMIKNDLKWFAGVNCDTVLAISKGQMMSKGALKRICNAFRCDVSDVFRIVEWDDVTPGTKPHPENTEITPEETAAG